MGGPLLLLKSGLGIQWSGQELIFEIVGRHVSGVPLLCVSGTFALAL